MQLSFQTRNSCFFVELNNSPTALDIAKRLPLDSKVSTWGDEIYFQTQIDAAYTTDQLTLEVTIGDVAYWPEGKCICVFFGATPLSKTERPQPASPVVLIGKTKAIPTELKKIKAEDPLRVVSMQKAMSGPLQNTAQSERKLTQSEIDALVQQLLSGKPTQGTS